jgi:hypothetical protein
MGSRIEIVVSTPGARLWVDGARVDGSRYVAMVPRAGGRHSLHVEATGFASRDEAFDVNEDIKWLIALEREGHTPVQARTPPSVASAQPAVRRASPSSLPATSPAARPIHDDNPYEH